MIRKVPPETFKSPTKTGTGADSFSPPIHFTASGVLAFTLAARAACSLPKPHPTRCTGVSSPRLTPSGNVLRANGPVLMVIRYTVCSLP